MYLPGYKTNTAEFWTDIITLNSGTNPTDFMSNGVLQLEIKLKQHCCIGELRE
jgi:hypothetical protein